MDMDRLADELFERMSQRQKIAAKKGRSDVGTGDVRIGDILRQWRGDKSYRAVADATGLDPTFIYRIEKGLRGMSIETLATLHDYFGGSFSTDVLNMVLYAKDPDRYSHGPGPTTSADQQALQAQPRATEGNQAGDGIPLKDCLRSDARERLDSVKRYSLFGNDLVLLPDSE